MSLIKTEDRGDVRIITLDNPPVNSLSYALSGELVPIVEAASADPKIRAVIFVGAGGQFSAGADINDFGTAPTPQTKTIRDVIAAVEKSEKTFVAAIEKMAFGGGLELALASDYRVALADAKVGLPEIKIGLLPGAGGTQRLPRLIGAQDALDIMLKGRNVKMDEAKEKGIVDEVVTSNLLDAAIALANKGGKRRVSHKKPWLGKGLVDKALPFVVSQAHKMVPPEDSGGFAAHKLIDAVEAAMELPFEFGLAREGRLFMQLALSAPSAALRHVFFAERELSKIPDLPAATPLDIKKAGVIGAGTMGTGIAITFAQAGIPVHVIDSNEAAVDKAKQTVMGMFMYQVQKGRMTQEEAWKLGQAVQFTDDYNELADADVVVEAVFENMDVKKEVFAKLDAIVKPEGILASNTSTLDIDAMAAATKRPDKVIGLHFFVPANIMPLLEIVRGKDTSPETIATAFKLAKTLKKTAVLARNAFGFIGNRMIFDYSAAAGSLAEEGVSPARIDAVAKKFGFPMGPFAMSDLSGVDVGWRILKERPDMAKSRSNVLNRLVEMNRLGQKTGAGYFKYDKNVGKGREPIPDPVVEALFAEEGKKAGIKPREVSDGEILERLLYALINRGAYLLEEGVAIRPGDIDIAYIYGYGFPPHTGGPMWYADQVGVKNVYDKVVAFGWQPAPLLKKLAESNGKFADRGTAKSPKGQGELTHA
ncbi:MAG TPA: 3-hydroxyacyl-CoA dehydrogenase NAD-binding domain-containing protein [Candidatus Acidoferrum sp.]|jgi:3-hydroxyacyl-CoA dehydrogenase|nr:3-hydroxyacyl-CoA dehydrogenase NAD-binding domain-containing protein [Candidatus Acidoferrum sp.]